MARTSITSAAARSGTCILTIVALAASSAGAAGTQPRFTYQGRLMDNGRPANGPYDLKFRIYDKQQNGVLLSEQAFENYEAGGGIPASAGLFTVELDAAALFGGDERWIEVLVRPGASNGAFTTLSPRQRVACAPYAMHALGPWVRSGNGLEYPSEVGIGVPAGPEKLAVSGDVRIEKDEAPGGVQGWRMRPTQDGLNNSNRLYIEPLSALAGGLRLLASNVGARLQIFDGDAAAGVHPLVVYHGTFSSILSTLFRVESTGRVVVPSGDLHVEGQITRAFTSGTSDPAAPLAYAHINAAGSVLTGTPNLACMWNAASSRYEITIDNEDFFCPSYVTTVTPVGGGQSGPGPRFATIDFGGTSPDRKLYVYIWNSSDAKTTAPFCVQIFKPTN